MKKKTKTIPTYYEEKKNNLISHAKLGFEGN